jgi:4-cresol dehydrogenase (hydroxylating)
MHNDSALVSFADSIRQKKLAGVEVTESTLRQARSNVGEFQRNFQCLLRVTEKSALRDIVAEANHWRVPLFPFSRGFNWGYGSKLPTQDGGALLDLSGLNKILNIDEEFGVATVEPGVTQRQLAEELARRGSRFYVDVTGSGAETSLLGNALERGIAYGSLRAQQLAGMEILLGNGRQFRTGFGSYPQPALRGLYPWGLGPSLDGLFFQSNFGIVLEGTLQLNFRPDKLIGLTVSLQSANVPEFIDRARDLLSKGDLHGIPHLANRQRTISTIAPLVAKAKGASLDDATKLVARVIPDDWMLTAAVAGSPSVVSEKLKHIRKAFGSLGRVHSHALIGPSWKDQIKTWCRDRILNENQRLVIEASAPLRGFHEGKPSDAGIQFLLDVPSQSVDDNPQGFLLCTPLAPLSGTNSKLFVQMTEELAAKHRVRFAMTLNMLTPRILEAVISIHFSRSLADESTRAHTCVSELTAAFNRRGFYPYRVNIDQQELVTTASPVMAEINQSIKRALDPNSIIAPGRYGLR